MGSSDHKSSTRRFHKVLSTLKGNSPNSSLNVPNNKEMSESSNPYYEQVDSPYLRSPLDEVNLMTVDASPKRRIKKNSSKNITIRLSENYKSPLKSDRSARNKNEQNLMTLSVGGLAHHHDDDEYIQKLNSNEIKLPVDIDDQDLLDMHPNASGGTAQKNNFFSSEPTTENDLVSSESGDYLEDIDSPISTDDEFYEDFFDAHDYEDSSVENIDDPSYNKEYESIGEEERKLSMNDSKSSYNTNQPEQILNQKTSDRISVDEVQEPKSFRQKLDKKINDRYKITVKEANSPKKKTSSERQGSSSGHRTLSSMKEGVSSTRLRRSDNRLILFKSKQVYLNEDDNSEDFEDTTPTGAALIEDKSFANEKIKESDAERVKKDADRKTLIDKLKKSVYHNYAKEGIADGIDDDEDLIMKLQPKIMLVTKHPEIKDPKKKMKPSK